MSGNTWQRADVAHPFLAERRALIPYGGDQLQMLLHLVRHFRPDPRRLVDLGCGSGVLAQTLLEAHADVTALLLDFSEPMLAAARESMAPWRSRCEIRRADLREPLLEHLAPASVDLVVSGYAIHHLPHLRKRELFREIYEVLQPGGLFVNLEHVASSSAAGEALFDELFIDHLTAVRDKLRSEVERGYHDRPDKADNILERVEVQVDWLREVGFQHADCYFKWLELAVFAGVKP